MYSNEPDPIVYGTPSRVAAKARNGSTAATPGTAATASIASSGIRPKEGPERPLAGERKRSDFRVSSTHSFTVSRKEPTMTATETIIEMPIVSAATATDVRERLPVKFARAMRASTPNTRSAKPSSRAAVKDTAAGEMSDAAATTRNTDTKPQTGRLRTGPGHVAM